MSNNSVDTVPPVSKPKHINAIQHSKLIICCPVWDKEWQPPVVHHAATQSHWLTITAVYTNNSMWLPVAVALDVGKQLYSTSEAVDTQHKLVLAVDTQHAGQVGDIL